jgi:beta-lactamase class A
VKGGELMQPDWSALEHIVSAAEQRGVVGVSLSGPHDARWCHNGGRAFRAASTVKIPLMIEVMRGVDRGDWALADRQTVNAADKARGSGVLTQLHDGLEVTLADLLYLTISISDNTATNLLIQRAGMPAVNATMRELGMRGSNLGREMKGRPALAGETENMATPDDYARVTQAILEQRAASPSACDTMIALLEQQQNARRIARYLPDDDTLRWGSKTGSINGVTNDVGFVSGPAGTLVIAVFCEAFPDQHEGEQVIGDITRAALRATGVATLGAAS